MILRLLSLTSGEDKGTGYFVNLSLTSGIVLWSRDLSFLANVRGRVVVKKLRSLSLTSGEDLVQEILRLLSLTSGVALW